MGAALLKAVLLTRYFSVSPVYAVTAKKNDFVLHIHSEMTWLSCFELVSKRAEF